MKRKETKWIICLARLRLISKVKKLKKPSVGEIKSYFGN